MRAFTPEQDQYLQLSQTRAFYQGLRDGIMLYSEFLEQGRSLKEAIEHITQEERNLLTRFDRLKDIYGD